MTAMAGVGYGIGMVPEEWATLLLLAVALGLDAFSVGLGVGLTKPRPAEILRASAAVGVLHVAFPMAGLSFGMNLHYAMGDVAKWLGSAVLIVIGGNMIWHSMREKAEDWMRSGVSYGWLLYAVGVSLDSLTAGFGLGLFNVNPWGAAALFGVSGALLSAAGLAAGQRVGRWLGGYSEAVGGALLIAVGCHFLL
ncbi:MAG: manganese efflux pump [Kyrpidia tusciae]|nr:manganese efflux pump [Kyrpidia tusciae]MBE3552395.1 manganese efflux pump [Kyrpidia tusciae]